MDTVTLPPIKNVDADMLKKLRARMPVHLSLIVRTALAHMAAMPEGDYWDAIVKQAEREDVEKSLARLKSSKKGAKQV